MGNGPTTLFEKIWDAHVVLRKDDGRTLLFIDRHLIHDGSFQAFARLTDGAAGGRPQLCLGTPDHYVPTVSRSPADAPTPARDAW